MADLDRTRLPMTSSVLNMRRAKSRLTIITGAPSISSPWLKSRPRIIGIPRVRKNPGSTTVH